MARSDATLWIVGGGLLIGAAVLMSSARKAAPKTEPKPQPEPEPAPEPEPEQQPKKDQPKPPVQPKNNPPTQWRTIAGHQVYIAGPQASGLPLVVGFHGISNDPSQLFSLASSVAPYANVALIQGPVKSGSSWKYFSEPSKGDQAKFASQLTAAVDKIYPVLATLRNDYAPSKVVAIGSSQGGHIAYKLARDGSVDAAIPVAGALPASLYPNATKATIVRSFHGTKDSVVPYAFGEATSAAFSDAGYNILFTPVNAGHVLSAMESQIKPTLVALVL